MDPIKASLSNVSLSKEKNKMIITGCIAKVGEASTGSPCGAGGYFIVFTPESVEKCGKTFEGMPLNCVLPEEEWLPSEAILSGHGNSAIGYLRKIKVKDDNIMAEIVLWKEKYPWLAELTVNAMDALGFSVEMYPTVTHEDDKNNIQYIDEFEGVGCAMLWSNTAAFSQTFIEKIAANRSDKSMNEEMKKEVSELIKAESDVQTENINKISEELKASAEVLDELKEAIGAMTELKESFEQMKVQLDEQGQFINDLKASAEDVEELPSDELEKVKAELEEIKAGIAQPVIPVPKAGQQVAENPNLEDDKGAKLKAEIEKINASSMSNMDKLKAIARAKMEG